MSMEPDTDLTRENGFPSLREGVELVETEDGTVLQVPLEWESGWKLMRHVLPLSDERRLVLDELSAELIRRCDGSQSVEALTDWLAERWHLTYYEARGLLHMFLGPLVKRGAIIFRAQS